MPGAVTAIVRKPGEIVKPTAAVRESVEGDVVDDAVAVRECQNFRISSKV